MAANTSQIFSKAGVIAWGSLTAANTAMDGTGTVLTIFTADATNGGRFEGVRAKALGTNVASVARIFINNGSTNTSAANNSLVAELDLPATTASNAASNLLQEIPSQNGTGDQTIFPMVLPAGYKVNVCLGTAVAAGWQFTGIGGAY